MCGIAGFASKAAVPGDDVAAAMLERIRSRGPDGHGARAFGPATLLHRRLAILDLAGGAQPLSNEDGTVWITFNGEIYNFQALRAELESAGHRFRTRSDTEVVVHAYEQWGSGCLSRLRGMFAFAIWDEKRGELFLARDRVGIKPLLYLQQGDLFAFASELRAFEAIPCLRPRIDEAAIDLYLHFQYIPAPLTIFKETRKLPPGHFLVWRADGSVQGPTRYWELRFEPDVGRSEDEWLEELDAALDEAVRLHLVSDVPFGAFLSGGVDSTTVVAYMRRHLSEPVETFTIGFEEAESDESPHAAAAARRLGTKHRALVVKPDALGVLPELVEHYGEPFGDSSAIPTYYVSRLASQHVKMVLSGDGGDENFAGYSTYARVIQTQRERTPRGLAKRSRHAVANVARSLGVWPQVPWPTDTANVWRETVAYFHDEQRARLWRPEFRHLVDGTRGWFENGWARTEAPDVCSRLQKLDIETYLPYDILTKVDVASMCHGLEVRVPLLDHVLMETVARMPADLKLRIDDADAPAAPNGSVGKYLLKRLAARHVDRATLDRPKQGFSLPIDAWFRGPLKPALEESVLGSRSRLREYLDPAAVRAIAEQHERGGRQGFRLWALLFLEAWLERHHARAA